MWFKESNIYHTYFALTGVDIFAPVPVKQPWRVWMSRLYETIKTQYMTSTNKAHKVICIFYGIYDMEYWNDMKYQALTLASDIETWFPCKILQCNTKAKFHQSKLNTPHSYIWYKCQAQNSWCQANIIIHQTTCPAIELLNVIARIECWNNCPHKTCKMRGFCDASPCDFKVCFILSVFYDVILCGTGCQ